MMKLLERHGPLVTLAASLALLAWIIWAVKVLWRMLA